MNGVKPGAIGHFDIQLGSADGRSSNSLATYKGRNGAMWQMLDILFAYRVFVDNGTTVNDLGSLSTVTQSATLVGPGLAEGRGYFTGLSGQRINWKATSRVDEGDSLYTPTYEFTSESGGVGTLRLVSYVDQDILIFADDFFTYTGSAAAQNFAAYTIDGQHYFGYAQFPLNSHVPGLLERASYQGFAVAKFATLRDRILNRTVTFGQTANPGLGATFNIDTTEGQAPLQSADPDFPQGRFAGIGSSSDVSTALSWSADPAATSVIITPYFRNVGSPVTDPVSLNAIVLPLSVGVSSSGTGSLALSAPAPAGGLVINLASNAAVFQVPSTVTIPAGELSTGFSFTTGVTASDVTATVTADIGGSGAVQTTVLVDVSPDIGISGSGVSIPSGDVTPAFEDLTQFGKANISGGTVVQTFTITNSGSEQLNLTGSPSLVALSGTGASSFSVTTQPASSAVASGGGTQNFQITFDPATSGLKQATVSITSNDSDESPFSFAIQGTGITAPTVATPTVTNVTFSSATLGGNVSSDGADAITERGVVFSVSSLNSDPQVNGANVTKVTTTGTTGVFTVNVSSLAVGTGYSFAAYAINSAGTTHTTPAATFTTAFPVPTVATISPTSGRSVGGTNVTITGTGFTGASAVTIGGNAATGITVVNSTTIIATTPAGALGSASVIVTTPGGMNPANSLFTYTEPETVVHDGSHSLAPELTDGQVTSVSFGSTAPNAASIRSFLVRNTGDGDLTISSFSAPSGFTTSGAAATLAPGTTYTFQVALASATPATYSGSITINSDDLNEAAFDFPVSGTVVAAGSAPVVTVSNDIAVQGSTGSTVLGGPVGSTLYNFIGSPALNSTGVLASAVQIRHADASIHTGMMSGQPLTLIATDTQTAVGMAVGVTYSIFNPPVINEAGHIAFTGEVRGPGITKGVNNRCLFSNASDGVLKLAAQIGMSTTLGSNLKTIGNFSIGGDLIIFLGTLVDDRTVLFGWDASTGLRPLVRTGQTLSANGPTKTVQSFAILETSNASSGHGKELSVAPTGESLVTAGVTFTDGTYGVVVGSFDGTSDTNFGATYGASQQLADTYAAPAAIPLAKWNTFRSPGFDNTGNYYGFISQMVTNALAGVSSTNNVGVFVDTAPGVLTLQLRENAAAPGTGAGVVFNDFSDLVLGGGDYEFLVKGEVRGSGVVTNVNNVGLWAQHATNGLELIAREGSEAPGVSGSSFFRLNQIALPGTSQPMFQATMKAGVGGVTTADDTGLWVVNENGVVKLAVREGDVLDVGGTPRTVTAITALLNGTTTGGALGRRVFLADGQLTLLLTFSGGVQANAKVVVP